MPDRHAPPQPTLDWAASIIGEPVVAFTGLREGAAPWLLRFGGAGGQAVLRLAPAGDPDGAGPKRTEIAALRLAHRHGIAVPRLLGADLTGHGALLISAVPGRSTIPRAAPPGRLLTLGAAAAAVHAVPLEPEPHLPARTRPIATVDFAAERRRSGTTPLLAEAETLVAGLPQPAGGVFVHGDLWQGNTLWSGDSLAAIVDWDCAGSGHPGVDLGSLRCDAAMTFGLEAADSVSTGWATVMGREPDHAAYWDVVAALSTPTHLDYFVDAFVDQGRYDLDRPTALRRRDDFLTAALEGLRSH
jgi:aminoglycoside phosphotransferase (APT) family kinase protein